MCVVEGMHIVFQTVQIPVLLSVQLPNGTVHLLNRKIKSQLIILTCLQIVY